MWELFPPLQSSHRGAWVFAWAAAGVSECIQEHPGIIFQRCSNFTSVYELCGEQPVSHTIIINLGAHSEEELREERQLLRIDRESPNKAAGRTLLM